MGILFTILMGFLFTIVLGIQFTVSTLQGNPLDKSILFKYDAPPT